MAYISSKKLWVLSGVESTSNKPVSLREWGRISGEDVALGVAGVGRAGGAVGVAERVAAPRANEGHVDLNINRSTHSKNNSIMYQSLTPNRRIAGQADWTRLLVGSRDQRRVLEDDLARLDVASGDGISEMA